MSAKQVFEYSNKLNGGTERVAVVNGAYYVNSNFGKGFQRHDTKVSRDQIKMTMQVTGAPETIVSAILAN